MHRRLGNRHIMAGALTHLGDVRMRQGEYDQARRTLDEALALGRALGDPVMEGQTLLALGGVTQRQGDLAQAQVLYRDALTLLRTTGAVPSIVYAVEGVAALLTEQEGSRATRLWGASAAIREALGLPIPPAAREEYNQYLARAHAQMTEATWLAAWNEGHAMSLEEATDDALVQSG